MIPDRGPGQAASTSTLTSEMIRSTPRIRAGCVSSRVSATPVRGQYARMPTDSRASQTWRAISSIALSSKGAAIGFDIAERTQEVINAHNPALEADAQAVSLFGLILFTGAGGAAGGPWGAFFASGAYNGLINDPLVEGIRPFLRVRRPKHQPIGPLPILY